MTETVLEIPLPQRDALSAPYWDALDAGRHVFQRCRVCANAWLPPRHECPRCLQSNYVWEEAGGAARLISNLVDAGDPEALRIDQPLRLTIEREAGVALPRYRPETR